MKKSILIIAMAFALTARAQKKEVAPVKQDTVYTVKFNRQQLEDLFKILGRTQKLLDESPIAARDANPGIRDIEAVIAFFRNQLEKTTIKKEK